MPQMGESIAEGTVSRWLKKVGDPVKRDEPLFEISTDKVDAEIPAADAGVLIEVLVAEGQTVAVQAVVARLETSVDAGLGAAPAIGSPHVESGAAAVATAGVPSGVSRATGTGTAAAVPGVNGGSLQERLRARSTPLVRKIAAEHGVELRTVRGTGMAGRVTKKDILGFIDDSGGTHAPPVGGAMVAAVPGAATPHAAPSMPEPWPGDVVEPMSKMRALISEHMVASRRTAAHVTSVMEVDLTRVAGIRAKQRAHLLATGVKLTYLPFIIKATTDALRHFPIVNASVSETRVIYRKQINIGVAVALDWGLIVPVIRHADELSVTGIARRLADLAGRARSKRLQPADVQNGTFTITNPGVFGSLLGTPIINQPQVAIMGVGAIEKRVKVMTDPYGGDSIVIRTCAYLSLSFDHRAIDGAVGDQFLALVKRTLESYPDSDL
ncbi:MAG: dihydrolipoamide acetyltransferase family protein [Gemmatimonadaceae bacterium]